MVDATYLIPVLFCSIVMLKSNKKKSATGGSKASLFVIKHFDNDELTFAKAKSRLFVEK